jgi:ferredoxin
MNIAIHYYSATGNTLLACRYIGERLSNAGFELFDITKKQKIETAGYDAVGFAAPTFFFGLPRQEGKPAFVFNTYGMMSGRTLRLIADGAARAGFAVFSGHSFHMPESYPPFIVKGWGSPEAPDGGELAGLDRFIVDVAEKVRALREEQPVGGFKAKIDLFSRIMPRVSPVKAHKKMGFLSVDESLCRECGTCRSSCPSGAIGIESRPVFDPKRCIGCWICFNSCPRKAIFTPRIRGIGQYSGPNDALISKLSPREAK